MNQHWTDFNWIMTLLSLYNQIWICFIFKEVCMIDSIISCVELYKALYFLCGSMTNVWKLVFTTEEKIKCNHDFRIHKYFLAILSLFFTILPFFLAIQKTKARDLKSDLRYINLQYCEEMLWEKIRYKCTISRLFLAFLSVHLAILSLYLTNLTFFFQNCKKKSNNIYSYTLNTCVLGNHYLKKSFLQNSTIFLKISMHKNSVFD